MKLADACLHLLEFYHQMAPEDRARLPVRHPRLFCQQLADRFQQSRAEQAFQPPVIAESPHGMEM